MAQAAAVAAEIRVSCGSRALCDGVRGHDAPRMRRRGGAQRARRAWQRAGAARGRGQASTRGASKSAAAGQGTRRLRHAAHEAKRRACVRRAHLKAGLQRRALAQQRRQQRAGGARDGGARAGGREVAASDRAGERGDPSC
jgi:hypothetical protein